VRSLTHPSLQEVLWILGKGILKPANIEENDFLSSPRPALAECYLNSLHLG